MVQSNLYITRETLFGKGYNDTVSPEYIPEGYLAVAKNVVITNESIEKRTGYSIVGQDMGDKKILGLGGVTTGGGTRRLYAFLNKSDDSAIEIWEWSGSGNWSMLDDSLLTNAGSDVELAVAEGVGYAFDGSSTPVKITPGSPTTVAAVTDGNFPAGKNGIWFHNFFFVFGTSSNKSRLYWSDLEDSDDFTNGVTGSVDINPDDGDEITALASLGDELIIFKRNRIWSLTGFGTASFTVQDVNEKVTGFGTTSQRSVVNVGNDLYYISHTGGTPQFRSLQRTRFSNVVSGGVISDDIQGTLEGLNTGQMSKVAGVYDGRRLFYAVPESGQSENSLVLVYDTRLKGWVQWTGLLPSVWAEFDFGNDSDVYFGNNSSDSTVFVLDNSTNDNGTAIDMDVQTRRYGGDRPELKKKWKYLYITVDEQGDYDLDVDYSEDGFSWEDLGTVPLNTTDTVFPFVFPARLGATDIKKARLYFAKRTSYFMQIRYRQSGLDEECVIRDWEILHQRKSLRHAPEIGRS